MPTLTKRAKLVHKVVRDELDQRPGDHGGRRACATNATGSWHRPCSGCGPPRAR